MEEFRAYYSSLTDEELLKKHTRNSKHEAIAMCRDHSCSIEVKYALEGKDEHILTTVQFPFSPAVSIAVRIAVRICAWNLCLQINLYCCTQYRSSRKYRS